MQAAALISALPASSTLHSAHATQFLPQRAVVHITLGTGTDLRATLKMFFVKGWTNSAWLDRIINWQTCFPDQSGALITV